MVTTAESRNEEKAWFLRALLVLQDPRPVFAALRDDSDEVAEARQDAAGAIVWLAGIAAVLATTVASRLLDDVGNRRLLDMLRLPMYQRLDLWLRAVQRQPRPQAGHSWRKRLLDPVTTLHLFILQVLHGNTAVSPMWI